MNVAHGNGDVHATMGWRGLPVDYHLAPENGCT